MKKIRKRTVTIVAAGDEKLPGRATHFVRHRKNVFLKYFSARKTSESPTCEISITFCESTPGRKGKFRPLTGARLDTIEFHLNDTFHFFLFKSNVSVLNDVANCVTEFRISFKASRKRKFKEHAFALAQHVSGINTGADFDNIKIYRMEEVCIPNGTQCRWISLADYFVHLKRP